MVDVIEEIEGYRKRFIGSEEALNAYYGAAQITRPAYVKGAQIIDTGVISKGTAGGPYYHFDCRTSIMRFNCRDQAMGYTLVGWSRGGMIYAIVLADYEKARDLVYAANPCPGGYIDVRTLEQYYAGCCPKALGALMMV